MNTGSWGLCYLRCLGHDDSCILNDQRSLRTALAEVQHRRCVLRVFSMSFLCAMCCGIFLSRKCLTTDVAGLISADAFLLAYVVVSVYNFNYLSRAKSCILGNSS